MKTSINNPFSGGMAGFNAAAGTLQRNTIGDSINNLSQINARRGVQDLMGQGAAMTDPAMQSLAMGMSQPQQQAMQQRSDAQATLDQRGIANTLAQDKFGYQQTNDANQAQATVDAASTLFGRQNEQEATAQKNRLDVQDDQQNFQMHKLDVMNDNSLGLEEKKAKLKGIADLQTWKFKEDYKKSNKDQTPAPTPIQASQSKSAAEKLVEHSNLTKEEFGEAGGTAKSKSNWIMNSQFSPDQQSFFKNEDSKMLSDPYYGAKSIPGFAKMDAKMQTAKLQQLKEEYSRMDAGQKQDFLANETGKEVKQKGSLYQLLPNWFGISDYSIKDKRLK